MSVDDRGDQHNADAGDRYNTYTYVALQNNFDQTATITLYHRYSDDDGVSESWPDVAPGQSGDPALLVGYNTGFGRTGSDWWSSVAYLQDGSIWQSDVHACQLKQSDANQTLVFSVGPSGSYGVGFSMNIPSGSCWTGMTQMGSDEAG